MADYETTCTRHGAITNYFCPTCKAECEAELTTTLTTTGGTMPCPRCDRGNPVPHSSECDAASEWLAMDLPAMRAIVRAENPGMTRAEVAIEAIRRLG